MDNKIDAPLQSDQNQDQKVEIKSDPSDNLTPEHPRFKKVIEENHQLKDSIQTLKEEMDELRQSIKDRQSDTGDSELTAEEEVALAKIERQMQSKGYLKKEDLESEKRIERRSLQLSSLGEKYDGSDGYPKFVREDIVEFAKKRGIDDYREAYKLLNFDAIVQIESKKNNGANPPGSEPPTGGEKSKPGTGEFSSEQIANMSDEEYEKNREKIKSSLKPAGSMTA